MVHLSSGKANICMRQQLESKKLRESSEEKVINISPQIQTFAMHLYYIILILNTWSKQFHTK